MFLTFPRLHEIRKTIADPNVCWNEQALAIAKDLLVEVDRLRKKNCILESIASNGWIEAWHSGNTSEVIQSGESHDAVLNAWQNSQTLRAIQRENSTSRESLSEAIPQWMERPSGPGRWVCEELPKGSRRIGPTIAMHRRRDKSCAAVYVVTAEKTQTRAMTAGLLASRRRGRVTTRVALPQTVWHLELAGSTAGNRQCCARDRRGPAYITQGRTPLASMLLIPWEW